VEHVELEVESHQPLKEVFGFRQQMKRRLCRPQHLRTQTHSNTEYAKGVEDIVPHSEAAASHFHILLHIGVEPFALEPELQLVNHLKNQYPTH